VRIVRARAPARAALLGNPSDGYGGATLAVAVQDFAAQVTVYEWPELEVLPADGDRCRHPSLEALVDEVRAHGYEGGLRLVKAAIVRFARWCEEHAVALEHTTFSVRYASTVPREVGLGGSSAIVIATLRALCAFHAVAIPPAMLPGLALAAETQELGLAAGLQDRVVQSYEGLVAMDFAPDLMARDGHGRYEALDPALLGPLFLAHRTEAAQPSQVVHADLRARHDAGEPAVVEGMAAIATLAGEGRATLERGDRGALGDLMAVNITRRVALYDPDPRHLALVEIARACGTHANFAGSGGAVVGPCPDEETFARLEEAYARAGCAVLRPTLG
jgi:glucuronokinase